jgi:hypothetical protein
MTWRQYMITELSVITSTLLICGATATFVFSLHASQPHEGTISTERFDELRVHQEQLSDQRLRFIETQFQSLEKKIDDVTTDIKRSLLQGF